VLPREDQPPASPGLPREELNPVTNPLLAQNLGRWAQAYFTNPPEKRERAVMDLLQQLAGDAPETVPAVSQVHKVLKPLVGPVCARCQHSNHSGVLFCGLCGEALPADTGRSVRRAGERSPEQPNLAGGKQAAGGDPQPGEAGIAEAPDPALLPAVFRSEPAARRVHLTFGRAGIAVVIILAGLASWRWMSQRPAPPSNSGAPPKAATLVHQKPNPSAQAQRSPHAQKIVGASSRTTQASRVHTNPGSGEQSSNTTFAGVISPSSKLALVTNPTSTSLSQAVEIGPGTPDLLRARKFLAGKNGDRDPGEAAKWLWKAVAMGNASAAMLLANLYVSGDGVPKNCDQARLLLGAAARNSAAAGEELQRLETSGCQ
jgi:hypothetical protein